MRALLALLSIAVLTSLAAVVAVSPASASLVSAGEATSCGSSPEPGAVQCWGFRQWGQLGDGTPLQGAFNPAYDPVQPVGLTSGVTALTQTGQGGGAGNHSCAIVNGGAQCWGYGKNGQVGDGAKADRNVPVAVAGATSGVTEIDTNSLKTCAIVNGNAKCWGTITTLFTGAATDELAVATDVAGDGVGALHVATGWRHSCLVAAGGAVHCRGDNTNQQLGGGTPNVGGTPTKIVAGSDWNCALVGGGVKCWGAQAALGNNATDNSATPVTPTGLGSGVTDIDGNWGHACAIKADGTAWCWGEKANGRLGDGAPINPGYGGTQGTPVQVTGLTNVTAIATGARHTCAIVGASERWCWGSNQHGALGNEAAPGETSTPVRTLGATPKPPVVVTPPPTPKPKPLPITTPKPTPAPKAAILTTLRTKRVGRSRTVAVATIVCPRAAAASACRVSAPRTITLKFKRKTYTLTVSAPRSVRPGRRADVTVKLPRALKTRLAGKQTTIKLTLTVGGARKAIAQKVTA
jgi:hypothetical protein